MNDILVAKKIFDSISEANNILLIAHRRPDGDALGSLLALAKTLDGLGKNYTSFCSGSASPYFYFLPGIEKISHEPEDLLLNQFDLIITLDCGDLGQTGISEKIEEALDDASLVNIDHHRTNENFAHFNLVIKEASSTSEIIYRFFKNFNLEIDKDIATCLLTGILTDTGNFTNSATTVSALKVASDLLIQGARFNQINLNTSKNKSLAILKLWGRILARLEENESGVVSTVITLNDLEESDLDPEALEGVANFLNNLAGARTVLVLKEEEGDLIKGSLRSNDDAVDVSRIAQFLGGGGHRKAAGFTIKGQLAEINGKWRVV
jgi:phosphoesterase RecJ-like protein